MLRPEGCGHLHPVGKQGVDQVNARPIGPLEYGRVVAHDPHVPPIQQREDHIHARITGNDLATQAGRQGPNHEQEEGDKWGVSHDGKETGRLPCIACPNVPDPQSAFSRAG